jgi:hypothetical protein
MASDFGEIAGWQIMRRGKPPPDPASFPKIGMIEPNLACAFLYRTDSDVAVAEGAYTNPQAPLHLRVEALDRLLDGLIVMAKELGFRRVVATCRRKSIAQRIARHGFKEFGTYRMVIKELR